MDVVIQDPTKKVLYKEVKKQYDSFTFTADVTGEYNACFSNEFSTFSHKLVRLNFNYHGSSSRVCDCWIYSPFLVGVCRFSSWRRRPIARCWRTFDCDDTGKM